MGAPGGPRGAQGGPWGPMGGPWAPGGAPWGPMGPMGGPGAHFSYFFQFVFAKKIKQIKMSTFGVNTKVVRAEMPCKMMSMRARGDLYLTISWISIF